MWLLDRTVSVPGHGAFVGLGRPWPLRRLLGGHRRAARRHRDLPAYEPGSLLEFGKGRSGAPYVVAGWDELEEDHVWTRGGIGRLVLPVADPGSGPWRLEASCGVLLSPYRDRAAVDVVVAGRRIESWRFSPEWDPEWRTAELPAPAAGPVEVLFVVRHPATLSDLRFSEHDPRQLGMNLNRLRLGPVEPIDPGS
jgi:hypothetical protein